MGFEEFSGSAELTSPQLTEQQAQGLAQAAQARAAGAQPPSLADPASGAAQQALGFLSSVASR